MSPKPVWHSKCRTPASRNSATCSRTRAGEPYSDPVAKHERERLVIADLGIGPGVQHGWVDREIGRIVLARTCIMCARVRSSSADSSSSACASDSAT